MVVACATKGLIIVQTAVHEVITFVAGQIVIADATFNVVVASATVCTVITVFAYQPVIAGAAMHGVVTVATEDFVVATFSEDCVVAALAENGLGDVTADDDVMAFFAGAGITDGTTNIVDVKIFFPCVLDGDPNGFANEIRVIAAFRSDRNGFQRVDAGN